MPTRLVLLVDDDPDDGALTRYALRQLEQVRIAIARDGLEALELLRGRGPSAPLTALPDLVLLDLRMPRMSGVEFLRALRADPTLAHLAVVVFTSTCGAGDLRAVHEAGADACVLKPVEFAEFRAVVSSLAQAWLGLDELGSGGATRPPGP